MTESSPVNSMSDTSRRWLPVLLLLFVGSGGAALIYEIVWFQLLQLVIGSSAVSLGVLLGTFMGGMCVGSLLLPRMISTRRHPLRAYALLEIGIGVVGLLVLYSMPWIGHVYVQSVGHGMSGILLRGVVAGICLLPPTILMGATLPAIARWVEATPQGVSWMGFFYGGNIAGAVFGCLLAGFYLLRVHDMAIATYVAVAINFVVAGLALGLASRLPNRAVVDSGRARRDPPAANEWLVYLVIALSGMTALAAEVIWTRLLSLMLGATVYTFSVILAVFLFGLGVGSSAGSYLARNVARPRVALGLCQLLLAVAIAWAGYALTQSLPYWPINPLLTVRPWYLFQLDVLRCGFAIFPAACLWGASFPLALAAVAERGKDPGRMVGSVYAANTVGAIIGAILASLFLVRALGTQNAQQILVEIAVFSSLLMLIGWMGSLRPVAGAAMLLGIALMAALLALSVKPVPSLLVAYGRYLPTRSLHLDSGQIKDRNSEVVYAGEGMNASVAVTRLPGGGRSFHVSGRIEASTLPEDMRLQRMLGHIPALLHPNPRSVLVVGCGAGVTAGSFLTHPTVERIVVCEIEPLIPRVVAQHFAAENYDLMKGIESENPRTVNGKQVLVVYDDARHFVLTTGEKFDIITSDPIHPWIKGSATLYSKEYFELVKRHLNDGGLVTQWVPLYESNPATVKSEVATFLQAFPDGTVWANDVDGAGYDLVLLGSARSGQIDVDAAHDLLQRPDRASVAQSLRQVGFATVLDLLATYTGRGSDLRSWLSDAEINMDRNLRLQYLAGMGLNSYRGDDIYTQMLRQRRYPEDLFTGSLRRLQTLRQTLQPMRNNP